MNPYKHLSLYTEKVCIRTMTKSKYDRSNFMFKSNAGLLCPVIHKKREKKIALSILEYRSKECKVE